MDIITFVIGIVVLISSVSMGATGVLQQTVQYLGFIIASIFICSSFIISKIKNIEGTIESIIDDKLFLLTLFYNEQFRKNILEKYPDAKYVVYITTELKLEQNKKSETVCNIKMGTPVKYLKTGEKVKIKKENTLWINIETQEGKSGWCTLNCLRNI